MRNSDLGRKRPFPGGFTMIELMIVMGVIAILVTIAYPLFTSQIQKGRRADAQQQLLDVALEQEKYRANNVTYGSCEDLYGAGNPCPAVPGGDNWGYTLAITENTATTYTIEATATGDQTSDNEGGTSCTPLTLDESDNKCAAVCWKVDPASVTCP